MPLTITLVSAESGEITNVQVLSSDNIRALQHKAYNDLQVPPPFQDLRHNGTTLDLNLTISASGLSDGDLIMVHRTQPTTMQTQNFGHSETALLASLRANPSLMSALHAANPSLHARVTTGDASALPHVAALLHAQSQQQSFQDPMSSDAQRAIEERIREENVMQNMEAAIEHNPESFGKVVMLFVDCKINSVPGVKAFVDSGAQATIISKQCSERCNILRLMDTRFSGTARGVGTAKIYGRIHMALLTLGSEVFEVSFTVMDSVGGGYDILLGLDMLRKHQACIDLKENCLRIGGSYVPFLAEKDIPKAMHEQEDEQVSPTGAASAPVPNTPGAQEAVSTVPPTSNPAPNGTTTEASPVASAATSNPISETVLKGLTDLGFSRNDASEALRLYNGDAEQAAAMLVSRKYGL